jgi:hypothetical protein
VGGQHLRTRGVSITGISNGAVIDENTKDLAIKYLKRGVELKDPVSIKYLGDLYLQGKYVPKDTILGRKLEKEGRKLCGF